MKEQSGTLARIPIWIRGRPVFAFYVLAFSLTWLGRVPQAPHSRGLFPFGGPHLFGAGPMLAASVVLCVLGGREGDGGLFGGLLRLRVVRDSGS